MKNVLLMLLFLTGFAATGINAQVCSTPCPPACCVTTCTPEQQKNCSPEQMKNCSAEQQKACTPEQMKACSKMASTNSGNSAPACSSLKKAAAAEARASQAPAQDKPTTATAVLAKND